MTSAMVKYHVGGAKAPAQSARLVAEEEQRSETYQESNDIIFLLPINLVKLLLPCYIQRNAKQLLSNYI